jgi:hypothetical protein
MTSLWSIDATAPSVVSLLGPPGTRAIGNRSVRRAETLARWLPRDVDRQSPRVRAVHPAAAPRERAPHGEPAI